jgi:beta-glucosidase
LLQTILRGEWDYDGLVMSDWQSIGEMIAHGYASDSTFAAKAALEAGTDMDMMAEIYLRKLPGMVRDGVIRQEVIDNAVRRVLRLKWQLGLFEDPYRYSDTVREKKTIRSAENIAVARDVARKSIVLLKNEKGLLPLGTRYNKIALVGPLADNKEELNGSWSFFGEPQHPVSIREGLQAAMPNTRFVYAEGCGIYGNTPNRIAEAVQAARSSDLVIVVVGESAVMNGEAGSRSDLGLPGEQQQLVEALHATGKPVVVVLVNGRPLTIPWIDAHIPAVVESWTLGSETGHAVADVLTGAYNPSGKLPVTFPRNVGQVPIYYNHKNTGRPYQGDYSEPVTERVYRSKYRDVQNTPLYPFGYGLSYSTFLYGDLQLSSKSMSTADSIRVSVEIKNVSNVPGDEVVQLYIRDHFASVTRPVKELKAFQKVQIGAGESRTVTFYVTEKMLSFYRHDKTWGSEPGSFTVFVGTNSRDTKNADFVLAKP